MLRSEAMRLSTLASFALVSTLTSSAHADDAPVTPTEPAPAPITSVPTETARPPEAPPPPAPSSSFEGAAQSGQTTPLEPSPSAPPEAIPPAVLPADPYSGFRMGPMLSLGLPRLLGVGLIARVGKYVSVGVNYQVLPKMKLPIYSATATSFLIDGYGRLHPFGGAFYLSFGAGYQSTRGTATAGSIGAEGEISSAVLTASLGWFWMWNDGFGIGFEPLGLSVPVGAGNSSTRLTGDKTLVDAATEYSDLKQQVDDTVEQIGKYPVPQFNLVRMGLLF
jgi:hypothetical protein